MKNKPLLLQRRSVLKAIALAMLLSPLYACTNTPPSPGPNPDVVIVGAGAAGLAAAKKLQDLGVNYVIVEATTRIGGRCYTDNKIFGVPYDMAAHWLNNGPFNPVIDYATNNGFDIYKAPDEWKFYIDNHKANPKELAEAEAAYDQAYGLISKAGKTRKDISAREAVGEEFLKTPWGPTIAAYIGPWEMGKNLDDFSCQDWWSGDGGTDWFCREGYGAVLAHFGKDIPVQLSTFVKKIKWGGSGVTVQTSKGDIETKAVIVTVSTGVLAKEHIKFEPALPVKKQESFNAISMGIYNNIALHFTEDVFGEGRDVYVNNQYQSEEAVGFMTNLSNSNLVFGYVGGRFAADLETAGMKVAVTYALDEVKKMLGNDVEKKFIKGFSTIWGKMSSTEGAYASAKPGMYPMRKVLRETVADKVYFAGEACHRSMWATVGGAFDNGLEVATKVAKQLMA